MRHGLLHHPRGFHHLRQEHLARAEQIADDVHARHQRTFDHVERPLGDQARFLDVLHDEIGDAVDQRVCDPLVDRILAPGERHFFALRRCIVLVTLRKLQQPFGRDRGGG